MERVKGIEPSRPAWKAGTLPLSYTRLRLKATAGEPAGFRLKAKNLLRWSFYEEWPANRSLQRKRRLVEKAGFEPANACADRFTVCCH